jgi:hypothetical protein
MRHDPGLAASPPVRYMLKVERSGYSPFPFIGHTMPAVAGAFATGSPIAVSPRVADGMIYVDLSGRRPACQCSACLGLHEVKFHPVEQCVVGDRAGMGSPLA